MSPHGFMFTQRSLSLSLSPSDPSPISQTHYNVFFFYGRTSQGLTTMVKAYSENTAWEAFFYFRQTNVTLPVEFTEQKPERSSLWESSYRRPALSTHPLPHTIGVSGIQCSLPPPSVSALRHRQPGTNPFHQAPGTETD